VRTTSAEYSRRPIGATRHSVELTLVRVALAGNIAGATGADLAADRPGDEDEQRLTDHDVPIPRILLRSGPGSASRHYRMGPRRRLLTCGPWRARCSLRAKQRTTVA